MRPTSVTFVEVLNACANLGALEDVKLVHVINSFNLVAILISLWGITWLRCIQNVGALRMLGECSTRCHLKTWSLGLTILGGCAMHGLGKEALKHFEWMCEEGVQPNDITFRLSSISL